MTTVTLYRFLDNGEYYLSHKDFKQSLAVGALLKVKQLPDKIDIYGKVVTDDTFYRVENCEYPENVNLKIEDVEAPIKIYSVMEDITQLVSENDIEKALNKEAYIEVDYSSPYLIPTVNNDTFYEVIDFYFPQNVDVRYKRISKWYVENANVKAK